MGERIQYHRSFLMFKQEDAGYGTDREPSGYAKIEVKDGRGKASVMVQNLREDAEKYVYKAYLIKSDHSDATAVLIGTIPLERNKGEINWEFKPDNVGMTGLPIDSFNVVAVILEYINGQNWGVVCPLAAYRDSRVEWKDTLGEVLYSGLRDRVPEEEQVIQRQDVISKYTGELESKYEVETELPCISEESISQIRELLDSFESAVPYNPADTSGIEQASAEHQASPEPKEIRQIPAAGTAAPMHHNPGSEKSAGTGEVQGGFTAFDAYNPTRFGVHECIYRNKNMCNPQGNANGYSPCAQCFMKEPRKEARAAPRPPAGDVEKLKEYLGKYFESFNPFRSKRRDYRWWKVTNPVQLNNCLYQCSIKTPLIFNPRVLMSHFKYRHLIFGIFTDMIKRREYVVFGVPGVYNVDDVPFGEMCKWVQVEGNKPRYGAFGYWLVYVDPRNGKILTWG